MVVVCQRTREEKKKKKLILAKWQIERSIKKRKKGRVQMNGQCKQIDVRELFTFFNANARIITPMLFRSG